MTVARRRAPGPLAVVALAAALVGSVALAAAAQSPLPSASPDPSTDLAVSSGLISDPCTSPTATPLASFIPPSASLAPSPVATPSTDPSPVATPSTGASPVTSDAPSCLPLASNLAEASLLATVAPLSTLVATPTPVATAAVAGTNRKPGKVKVRRNVAFMTRQACAESRDGCVNRADIYYPSNRGPWPVIVTIHGRPRYPSDMRELAETLAAKGAVVFNIDYRGVRPAYTKGFPQSISDVACGIRFARQNARLYGGDRHHVVLVGHSMGGYVGAMVSLAGDTFPSAPGTCKSTLGPKASLPNGFVSVAGVSGVHRDYRIDQVFFGGTYAQIPGVWRRGTLYNHIGRRIGRNHRLKVGIIFERHDPFMSIGHATNLDEALEDAGYDSDLVLLNEGTTHFDILDTDRAIGRRMVKLIWHIIRESDPD